MKGLVAVFSRSTHSLRLCQCALSKRIVVINHRDEERLVSGILVQLIVELEFLLVISFELIHLFHYPPLK
jgi:hypothetical protein